MLYLVGFACGMLGLGMIVHGIYSATLYWWHRATYKPGQAVPSNWFDGWFAEEAKRWLKILEETNTSSNTLTIPNHPIPPYKEPAELIGHARNLTQSLQDRVEWRKRKILEFEGSSKEELIDRIPENLQRLASE